LLSELAALERILKLFCADKYFGLIYEKSETILKY